MNYRCVMDCLVQKNEKVEVAGTERIIEIANLRARLGEVYGSDYPLTEFNAPGEHPFFVETSEAPTIKPSRNTSAPQVVQGRAPVKLERRPVEKTEKEPEPGAPKTRTVPKGKVSGV